MATFFGLLDHRGADTVNVGVHGRYRLPGPTEQRQQHRAGHHGQPADHLARTERIAEHDHAQGDVNTGSNDDAIDAQADPTRAMPARKVAMARAVPITAMASPAA